MRGIQLKSVAKVLLGLLVVAACGLQAIAQTIPFPLVDSTWRYCSNNLDGVDWTNPSYDDSAPPWYGGASLLSNDTGNGGINPLIRTALIGPQTAVDGVAQHSYYFRKHFTVSGPVVPSIFQCVARVDDGVIIFLNGNPIYHLRTTNNTPLVFASSDFATALACGGDADCDDLFEMPAIGLREGDNVLAVILFQEGGNSSDITFGLGITNMVPAVAPTITDPTQPRDRVAPQNQTVVLIGNATGIPAPAYQWYKDGAPITGATGPTYTIQTMQSTDAGMYFCRVSNIAGSVDTRTANIQYTTDSVAPTLVRASADPSFTTVIVEFNEFLDPVTSQDSFNYGISGGLSLAGNPVLTSSGKSVVMTLSSAMAPDTDYTVTVTGVGDLALNYMTSANIMFRSWVPTRCGGLTFEAFNGTAGPTTAGTMAGNAVSVLTAHPSYPNSPSESTNITAFDSRLAYPDDSHEAYGARIRGLFLPPVTGNWRFYMRADDGSQLWLNPNGPSASGRQLVLDRTACCGTFLSIANSISGLYPLTAGNAYYIEALYKEGTGGDQCNVFANMEGEATPAAGTEFIPGSQLGAGAAPSGVVGPVVITQQPANQAVTENSVATFSVGAMNANGAPICYQWQRDGADIPGAAGASYSFTPVLADSGARFRVIVSVLGAEATSTEATLMVSVDNQGPLVIAALSSLDGTNITVKFNEKVEATSAEDEFVYTMAGFTINTAVLQANQTDVLLGISPAMAIGSTHQLSVSGINDLALNLMTATQVMVRAHVITYGCARYDLFQGLSATTVVISDLTGAPAYPHSPSLTRFKNIMELNTADEFEGYGTRMTGFLIPPTSGDYVFYFHSDDNGEFYLSTDASPVNRVLLCNEPVWANRREWTGAGGGGGRVGVPSASGGPQANISGPRNLTAGQMYYFEALMKEGGGGDNMGVTWKPPGGADPVNNTPSAIPASALVSLADPVSQSGNIKGPAIVFTPVGPNMYRLTWADPTYQLQIAAAVTGPWGPYPGGAASGVVVTVPATGNGFLRLFKQ